MKLLFKSLKYCSAELCSIKDLDIRYIVRNTNLAVNECLHLAHAQVDYILLLLNFIKALMKGQDASELIHIEFRIANDSIPTTARRYRVGVRRSK